MLDLVMLAPYPENPSMIERGVESVTVYLLEGLKAIKKLNIQVISFSNKVDKPETSTINGIKVHFLPRQHRFGNITLLAIERYRARRKIEKIAPDIIHNQYHFEYPYVGSKPKCKTIATVHGIAYKESPYEKEKWDWVRKYPRIYMERIVLRNLNHIICVTNYVKENIEHLTNANLYVIENPVSNKYFEIQNKEIPYRVLFVGAIIKRKNIIDLLKAINLLKDKTQIELHVVGIPEERYYYKILNDYVNSMKLQNNVKFVGPLSEEELLEEYRQCALLVLCSYEESAGMVLQQAMAAGKPVIANRVGGVPCIVNDELTGFLVEIGDIMELANKIDIVLRNKDLRNSLGEMAKKEALQRFKPEIIAQKTFEVYRKILST